MKIDRLLYIIFGGLIVLGVGAALFAAGRNPLPPSTTAPTFTPKPEINFSLKLFSGQTITLKDFDGKTPVVINFWASWCQPCRDEAPVLAKVSKTFQGKVEFIGIVTNDTQDKAQAFMNEFGITYDNGIDQSNIATKYGITGIPETFWIDKQGRIVDHWIGAIDEAGLTLRTQRLVQ